MVDIKHMIGVFYILFLHICIFYMHNYHIFLIYFYFNVHKYSLSNHIAQFLYTGYALCVSWSKWNRGVCKRYRHWMDSYFSGTSRSTFSVNLNRKLLDPFSLYSLSVYLTNLRRGRYRVSGLSSHCVRAISCDRRCRYRL